MNVLLAGLAVAGCPSNKWEQAILDKHNEWRANTQPPAKDMYKVRWDSAIATNMYNWLARCDSSWPHSDQDGYRKNVGGYEFLGENLAYCAGTACEDPIDGIVGYLGQSWWDEKDDYNWASDSSRGGVTSHYTQMSSSNIYAIGCAAVECPSPGPYGWNGKWWEIGCQYGERGQGYWVGTKPFESGSGGLIEPAASLLAKHPDICQAGAPTPPAPTPPAPTPPAPTPPTPPAGTPSGAGCPQNKWEQAILDKHNEWRANTQPPAKDMYKVRWDSAIATNMYNWLARCDSSWPHSDQDGYRKNVGGYEFLGENLAYCAGTACEDPIDGIVGYLGQSWWDEKDDYNWASDSSRGGVTSHYTQMSSSNIYAIGCAAVECPSPGPYGWNGKWWEIGCQYGERGQGYWVGTKPFESGSGGLIEPAASLLAKHPDICQAGAPTPPAPTPPAPTPPAPTPPTPPAGTPSGAGCPQNKWEQAILDKHNEWRANTQPPAKDMYKVRWDSAIATNMYNWLARCDSSWPHSDQDGYRKNVGGYEFLGENLAYCAGTACEDPIDGIVGYLGQSWWDEKDDYNWASDSSRGGVTSHYTQMSSSNIYAIGCAAVECPSPGPYGWNGKWWEIGCQYGERGQGYWVGTKPFESGSGGLIEPAASLLAKHPDICQAGAPTPPAPTPPAPTPPAPTPPTPPAGTPSGAGCPQNKWEQAILDKHNEWRANTQPPAKDMYKVRWDSAIATNMYNWLARCDSSWPHSDQDGYRKNVGGYEFLGENLAYCAGTACEDPIDGIVGYLGQSWWDEKDDYNWASDSSRGGVTSHYTQMSSSNIYAIGCAAVECPSPGPYGWNGKWWEIGCQYGERGQGYWVGTKPFESGSGGLIEPAASLLAKHPDICQAGAPTPPAPTPPAPTPPAPTPPTPPAGTPSGAGCPQNKWEQAILDKHNEWRANTQPPAKDMYKVRWDSAIATNMYNWLARCDSSWPHSDQDGYRKNVGGYEFLGENLAYCAGTACEDPIDGIVGYLGQSWWDEKDDYNWASDSSRGGVTSHYTQMSSSNIYAIGCAAVECPSPGPYGWNGKWWEIGCQYGERGQGYWVGTKPFESGSGGLIEPAASLLAKHPDICQAGAPTPPAPTPPAPTPPAPTPPTPPAGTPSGAGCPQNKWEQAILDKHNEWRANTQPPAKDMYKVRWDSAIATNMYNWLARCDSSWPHSDQDGYRKNVGGYEFLGENLAYCAGTACEDPIDGIVGYLGQSWWDEKDDYNWASDSSRGGVTSHYTQMSSSNIYAIGCAAVECPSPGPYGWNGKWWEIGCQYGERGQGYWVGTKPFESGSGGLIEPAASLLAKHPDICGAGAPTPPAPTPPAPTPPAPTPPTPPAGTPSGAGCPQNKWEQAILDKHNEWRANTQPPAKDMYKVRWDSAIATNMYNWLARCDSSWPHSDQDGYRKNVGGYEFLGENLAYCAGTACEDPIDGIVGYLGQSWWDEKDDYNWASDSSRGGVTSHYTQMSSSNIYAIGCAAVECPSPGPYGWNGKWWEIGCQYGERGQGYWVGTKPFESGSGGLIEPDASLLAKHPDICGAGAPPPTPPAPTPPAPTPPAPTPPAPTPPTPPAGTPSGAGCPQNKWEQAILDKHNEWRANTQPPAKDMYKVRWDSAIATNMYNWLARCDSSWPHSDQDGYRKNVGGYEFLGENLAYCAGTACEDPIDGIVGYLGQSWWDEKDDYNWASDSSRGGVTSHYTQMSSSNIYAIGCAAVECPSPGPYGWNGKWWEIGCQYGERGQGYWVGTKPFESGSGGLIEPDASLLAKHPDICGAGAPTPPAPTPPAPTPPAPTPPAPTPPAPTPPAPTPPAPTPPAPTTPAPTPPAPTPPAPTPPAPTPPAPTPPAPTPPTPVTGTAVPVAVVKPTSAPALTTMSPPGSTSTPVPGTAVPTTPVKPTSAPALTTNTPPGSTSTPVPGTAVPAAVVKPTSEPSLTTMSPPGSTSTPVPGTAVPAAVVKPTSEPSLTTMSPPGSTSTPVPGTAAPAAKTPVPTTMAPLGSTATPVPGTDAPAGGYQTISPQLGAGTGDSDDSSTDNWWIWLLVALGVLFACAAVIGAVVMKKKSDEGVQFLDFMDTVDAGKENNPIDPAFEGVRL